MLNYLTRSPTAWFHTQDGGLAMYHPMVTVTFASRNVSAIMHGQMSQGIRGAKTSRTGLVHDPSVEFKHVATQLFMCMCFPWQTWMHLFPERV